MALAVDTYVNESGERVKLPPVGVFASPEHRSRFQELQSVRLPSITRVVGIAIVPAILLIVAFLVFTPWVQVSVGNGVVTALDPADRTQSINALAGGRIARWFVRDGSTVQKGDPIVEIIDLDPRLIERLEAELRATESKYQSAKAASDTAKLDYDRKRRLLEEGLVARSAFEAAKIKYEELAAKEAEALAMLNQKEISLSRQSLLTVTAPRDGTIVKIEAGDTATLVEPGQPIATFVPSGVKLAAEIYISGLDASIVTPGRKVRLRFEGWPAVQFGGWPEVAIGTFGGIVTSVDPVVSTNGRFRVLVTEDPSDPNPWPNERYLRLGARVEGWILLNEVTLGYELWRRLNSFPPRPESESGNSSGPIGFGGGSSG
jgi:multidrug efflux pump subunit AcrA (membrane-fusion protein)